MRTHKNGYSIHITLLLIAIALIALALCVAGKAKADPPAVPAAAAVQRTPGQVIPIFLCGAGGDLENMGTNANVRMKGWQWTTREVILPRLATFYGGKAPAGSMMIVHLPFGRSPVATGPLADMPFDAIDLAKERPQLSKVADVPQFVRSMRAIELAHHIEICIYLGTVDHGHESQWREMGPAEFGAKVEEIISPFIAIPNAWVCLDAGGVMGPASNSWQVRLAAKRLGLNFGTEPWPDLKAECWAMDPDINFIVTSQLMPHVHDGWAVPRDRIRGHIIVLDTTDLTDEQVVAHLRNGDHVALNGWRIKHTAAEWAGLVSAAPIGD